MTQMEKVDDKDISLELSKSEIAEIATNPSELSSLCMSVLMGENVVLETDSPEVVQEKQSRSIARTYAYVLELIDPENRLSRQDALTQMLLFTKLIPITEEESSKRDAQVLSRRVSLPHPMHASDNLKLVKDMELDVAEFDGDIFTSPEEAVTNIVMVAHESIHLLKAFGYLPANFNDMVGAGAIETLIASEAINKFFLGRQPIVSSINNRMAKINEALGFNAIELDSDKTTMNSRLTEQDLRKVKPMIDLIDRGQGRLEDYHFGTLVGRIAFLQPPEKRWEFVKECCRTRFNIPSRSNV